MRTFLFCFLLFPAIAWSQIQYDILIVNGRILDGTGNSWFRGDIAIKNGKIIGVGKNFSRKDATEVIDVKDMIVAPGFIDVHTHIEGEEKGTPTADNFIYDGVTTVITGNCGSSQVQTGTYLRFIDSLQLSVNVATFIGHNSVRRAVMGRAMRDATPEELQEMAQLVETAMQEGAVGFSTGLIYVPGSYANTNEVVVLAGAAAKFHGVYASHIRNEGDSVIPAIQEAIYIGERNKMPVEISHFKVSGQQNWGRSKQTLAIISQARQRGLDVTIDQYPYTASSTSLSTLLPDAILADGQDSVKARLHRPETRQQVIKFMLDRLKKRKLKHFSYPVVANYRHDTTFNGKSIEQVNLMMGRRHKAKDEALTVIDMMMNGGASMVFHGMAEEDVKRILQYPFNMFASDASIRAWGVGVPHPRGYGTNARVLGKYVREQNIISLEEAVRRMTSLPAQKFQLQDRGLIRNGMAADIVVFDPMKVKDNATYDQPHQFASGIEFVMVNGQVVLRDGRHTGLRSGKALRGSGNIQ